MMASNKKQCTYNVSLWCVRIATASMEKRYVLNVISMHQHPCLSNLAYKLHILCITICHVWPVWLYPTSQHYLIKSTIFRKNLLNIKNVEIKCQLDATDDFYCRSYCVLNMFQASLCPSSGAREYYTSGCCPQTGHTTLSSTPYRQLENQSTKYDRQQPLV